MNPIYRHIHSWFNRIIPSKVSPISLDMLESPSEKLKDMFDTFTSVAQIRENLIFLEDQARKQLQMLKIVPQNIWHIVEQKEKELVSYLQKEVLNKPLPDVVHDASLPVVLVERTKEFLQLAGINPNCVTIQYNDTGKQDVFKHAIFCIEPFTIIKDKQDSTTIKPAAILFNKEAIDALPPLEQDQALIHAVTHIAQLHMEKLIMMQSIIGTIQFDLLMNSHEAHIYRACLERNADLLLSTKSYAIAQLSFKAFVNNVLDKIALDIPVSYTSDGSINCDFSITPSFLATVATFSHLEGLLQERYDLMRLGFKKFMSETKYQQFLLIAQELNDATKDSYTKPKLDVIHDKNLGYTLERTKYFLQKAGINPQAIDIIFDNKIDWEAVCKFKITMGMKDEMLVVVPSATTIRPQIIFSQRFLNRIKYDKILADWMINHEISHMLQGHSPLQTALELFYEKSLKVEKIGQRWFFSNIDWATRDEKTKTFMNLPEMIQLIQEHELQADILPLLKDKILATDIAKIRTWLVTTPSGKIRSSKIHMSDQERLLWCNAIERCWQKESSLLRGSSIQKMRFGWNCINIKTLFPTEPACLYG
jgi:hypothetical protein